MPHSVDLQEKYKQERERRLNDKGLGQYLDKNKTAEYVSAEDPWIAEGTPVQRPGMCFSIPKTIDLGFMNTTFVLGSLPGYETNNMGTTS